MEELPKVINNLNSNLREKLALNCPQLKKVIEVNIDDIEIYSYEYPWKGDETKNVIINGRDYLVRRGYLDELQDLICRDECQRLSLSSGTLDRIYYCYERICENAEEFRKAMEIPFFKFAYEGNMNGNRTFVLMDIKNSVVATMCFYLYHYNYFVTQQIKFLCPAHL